MDDTEIRVHPLAASYMKTLTYCINAAVPMVRMGLSYADCEDAIRNAAIETFELFDMPDWYINIFMSISKTAFKILSKKKRGSANEV